AEDQQDREGDGDADSCYEDPGGEQTGERDGQREQPERDLEEVATGDEEDRGQDDHSAEDRYAQPGALQERPQLDRRGEGGGDRHRLERGQGNPVPRQIGGDHDGEEREQLRATVATLEIAVAARVRLRE